MEIEHASSLLILTFGAFFVPLLSERIRIPAAVGEILFGILISPYVLGIIEPSSFTRFLADFGFAYLMFLVGLEIDFSKIERMGKRPLMLAGLTAVLSFTLGPLVALVWTGQWFLGMVLSAMSLGLVLVALRESDLTSSRLGQLVLLVGSIGEFLSIIFLTAAEMVHQHGVTTELWFAGGKLTLIFVLAWLILVVMRVLVWWFPHHFERVVRTHDTSEIGVRLAFSLMLGFIATAAWVGVEFILGAFIAGALFSFVFRAKEPVESKLSSFGFGFFIPFFFIDVGVSFDFLSVLAGDVWGMLGFLVLGSLFVKVLPVTLLKMTGLKWREIFASGLILSAPLTLLIAISKVGLNTHYIDEETAGSIVLFAIAGGVFFPVLFRVILGKKKAHETEPEALK